MIKIYGIKTCGSVRKALKFFNDNEIKYEYIDFRKDGITDADVDYFASNCDVNLLFNNKGTKYRQLGLKELNLDENGKVEWLKKDALLFKRPVIAYDDKVICAYDEDKYKELFL